MDPGFLIGNIPFVLLLVGFTSLAPLFRGRLKPISIFLVAVGFLVGILSLLLAYLIFSKGNYDLATLVILTAAGLMLFLRPVRNLRWAALVAFLAGLFISYYAYSAFTLTTTALIVIFVAATLLLYLLFKFAEDLLGMIGGILSFPPIAVIIGTICVVQAILILIGTSLIVYIPALHL